MEVARKRTDDPAVVLDLLEGCHDVVVPIANGEPVRVLDAIEDCASRLSDVRVHQMHALRDRPHIRGEIDSIRHVSYFLSSVTRPAYWSGTCDFTPAHFSEVPHILHEVTRNPVLIAASSLPDQHGWFSLGTNADYAAPLIGSMPVFLEANPNMPRTHGSNNVHVSQIAGWCESDHPLVEIPPLARGPKDEAIARFVAERVPDGATIQIGIGSTSSAVLSQLSSHRDLGVHTELLSDGIADLVKAGVVTGRRKATRPGRVVTTFALGSKALYDFVDGNNGVEFISVDWVNNPRVIGGEENFVSVNATCEVDMMGQANSEMINGRMWSGSGGQADFAHGAMFSPNGKGFLTLHSTNSDETVSRIKVTLAAGSPVTTLKNAIDHVVTEFGVAELFGQPVSVRARRLIDIAHPKFRESLEREAYSAGLLRD